MNFYKQQHKYYCGIDLHARKMYVCILDLKSKVKVHQNIQTDGEPFFEPFFPFLEHVIVDVECVFYLSKASLKLRPRQADSLICVPNTKSP